MTSPSHSRTGSHAPEAGHARHSPEPAQPVTAGTPARPPSRLSRELALGMPPAGPGGPGLAAGALAATRGGRTTLDPSIGHHPLRTSVLAHEAVHRAQFSAFGTLPAGSRPALEAEAERGGRQLLEDMSFAPAISAAPDLTLTYPGSGGADCPGGCHQPNRPSDGWTTKHNWPDLGPLPKEKTPAERLADQPKTIGAELERFDQSILAQRSVIFDRLDQDAPGVASTPGQFWHDPLALNPKAVLPPELRARYARALVASAVVEVAVKANAVSTELQENFRGAFLTFYHGLEELGSAYAVEDNARVARFDVQQQNWMTDHPRAQICPNCHAEVKQTDLRPPRPIPSAVPGEVAASMPAALELAGRATAVADWRSVLADFTRAVERMDRLLAGLLSPWDSVEAGNLNYLKGQREKLAEFAGQHPFALPVPAVFYPEDRLVDAQDQPTPGMTWKVPEAIPWRFYLYHTGATGSSFTDGEWVLVDMTAPKAPPVRSSATAADAFRFHMQKKAGPGGRVADVKLPKALTDQLDHKYHFTKGVLHFTHPTGDNDSLTTTEQWTASDWLHAIGMTLGAIALVATVLASGGLALGLAAPTIGAIGTVGVVAGVGAAGFNAVGTYLEMQEKARFGLLTPEEKERGYLSIALDIVGAVSLGLGHLATIAREGALALQASKNVSAFTRLLTILDGRSLFLLQKSAAVMKVAGLGADFLQVGTATVDFIEAFSAIRAQQGLSESDRDRALMKLIGSSLLTGTLLTISIRSTVHDLQRPRVPITVDEVGQLTIAGPKPGAPHETGAVSPGAKAADTKAAPSLHSGKITEPVPDPDLPEGRVEVRIVRDPAGQVIDAYTAFHQPADPHAVAGNREALKDSIAIHEKIAILLREDHGRLDELLHAQAKVYGGADAPMELQLELMKLFDETAAAERQLAKGAGSRRALADIQHRLTSLREHLDHVKAALVDPALRAGFTPDVVGVPTRPRGMPEPPPGHVYYPVRAGEWQLKLKATGPRSKIRFKIELIDGQKVPTNRQHIMDEFAGERLTRARQNALEEMGYVFQDNDVIRRPALHGTRSGGRMVPLELDTNGRLFIPEGAESIGEMQARLTGSLTKGQAAKLAGLRSTAGAGTKVVLVEGVYDTGITWAQILTKPKRAQLRAMMIANNVPAAEIDRLIDSLVTKSGTVKVVVGTRPVRAAHEYVRGFGDAYGVPGSGIEVHHGDPLYLGGGHEPASLLGLTGKAHDDLHAFFDALTLPSGPHAGTPLQPATLQAKVSGSLRSAAAVVGPDGRVSYEILGK